MAKFVADLQVKIPVWLDPDGAALRAMLPNASGEDGSLQVAMNILLDGEGRVLLLRSRDDPRFDPELQDVAGILRAMAGKQGRR